MNDRRWRASLTAFFDQRSDAVDGRPTLDELCFVAGRDPRVWRDQSMRDELGSSIATLLQASGTSSVLEVGSAAGFLALLLAPRVGLLTGVDLAEQAVHVARRLDLPNATFQQADGEHLPFADDSFDCAYCYDVFTNIPSFSEGLPIIREMLRVVRPRGKVLIGNVPDRARADDLPAHVAKVGRDLEARHGPLGVILQERPVAPSAVTPSIVTYDFDRGEFIDAGRVLGTLVEIRDVHSSNPYLGYRFNAVFHRED